MISLHTELLARAVPAGSVLQPFVQQMAARLHAALVSTEQNPVMAKGGQFAEQRAQAGADTSRYDRDQTMLSHLLNGIFPTIALLDELAAQGIRTVDATLQKIYILGFLCHDVDKIFKQQHRHCDLLHEKGGFFLQDAAAVGKLAQACGELLAEWGAADFLPDYQHYLGDIAFLAVNTQTAKGTSLTTYNFANQLKERDLALLRKLCTYSDLITYLVQSPSDVLYGQAADTLRELLAYFSHDQLCFAYHKLSDLRGMLSNVLNISITQFITQQATTPYLFFPNGTVYLQQRAQPLQIDAPVLLQSVKNEMQRICKKRITDVAPGFKFDAKSLVKKPDYYHDFLNAQEYINLLLDQIVKLTKNDISEGPAAKLRDLQAAGKIPATLDVRYTPDVRIALVARFLNAMRTEVFDRLPKAAQAVAEQQLAEHLGLWQLWQDAELIPNVGGFEYKWFWLAARYLDQHRGQDNEQIGVDLAQAVVAIMPQLEPHLDSLYSGPYLQHLDRYLQANLEIEPHTTHWAGKGNSQFANELQHYTSSKRKTKRSLLCTTCHSTYPTAEQEDAAVLFQPWVYKNKLPLYATKNAGGICAICSLELMMRQVLLKDELRLTGSKFEQLRTKYFYLYPSYFFTQHTAKFVTQYCETLQQISFFEPRKHIRAGKWQFADLLALEDTLIEPDESKGFREGGYLKMDYPKNAFPGLVMFGTKVSSKDTDTEGWAMPAWLGLFLPLLLNVKVVVTESPLPLFSSSQDFKESCILDGTVPYLKHVLRSERLRMDAIMPELQKLAGLYTVNIDTFAKQGSPEWNHLIPMARAVETDTLNLFPYLKRQQRGDSMYAADAQFFIKLVDLFESQLPIQERHMSLIRTTVDLYTTFYRPTYSSHSITKPVSMLAKEIINSPLSIAPEDLQLQLNGVLLQWMERVRGSAEGYAKFWGGDITTKEVPAVQAFVRYFYEQVFVGYCEGQRAMLVKRINAFKDGCEAYIQAQRSQERLEKQAQAATTSETETEA